VEETHEKILLVSRRPAKEPAQQADAARHRSSAASGRDGVEHAIGLVERQRRFGRRGHIRRLPDRREPDANPPLPQGTREKRNGNRDVRRIEFAQAVCKPRDLLERAAVRVTSADAPTRSASSTDHPRRHAAHVLDDGALDRIDEDPAKRLCQLDEPGLRNEVPLTAIQQQIPSGSERPHP
jgi:hypothetical protein